MQVPDSLTEGAREQLQDLVLKCFEGELSYSDNPMIDYNQWIERVSILNNRSQNLALIMIKINSKKDVF